MAIKFSVVTVVRNDLVGLQRSRQSLEAQTFTGWQHIIIDGSSNDGSLEYLKGLSCENTRFISEPDRGIYDAMNKAWKIAPSDSYVFYLNARDVFVDERALQEAHDALLLSKEADWGATTHEEIEQDGEGWVCKLVSPPSIRNQLYAYGYRSHQAVVMKASFIRDLGGFNENYLIASDWDLIVRALLKTTPCTWAYPLAKFELGGLSSKRLLDAHQELRKLRSIYLHANVIDRILDDLWCAVYLDQFEYRNYMTPFLDIFLKRGKSKIGRPSKQRTRFALNSSFGLSRIVGDLKKILHANLFVSRLRKLNIKSIFQLWLTRRLHLLACAPPKELIRHIKDDYN